MKEIRLGKYPNVTRRWYHYYYYYLLITTIIVIYYGHLGWRLHYIGHLEKIQSFF